MKRIFGLFLILLVLMTGNAFSQKMILGRPVFEKEFYDHTYIDDDGIVKIRDVPKVIKWDYFADELVIKWNKPENSNISFYVARIDSLERAINQGVVSEILDPIPLRQGTYPFSQEDLAMQAESGIDKFYSLRFRNVTPDQLLYWANELKKDPTIKSVNLSPVFKVVNHTYDDPLLSKQWNVPKISTPQAHEITFGNQNVYVFVMDTGVFLDHEDIDRSRNFVDYDAAIDSEGGPDDFGHGTHVYSTICAATNNGKGIVGLAPNVQCGNIRVLIGGSGSDRMVANGFLVAASKALEIKRKNPEAQFVMNVSLGGFGDSDLVDATVITARKAGILIVAAAGNSFANIDVNRFIPASSPGVVAVAATDKDDKLAVFSNYGPKTVLLAAPGVGIWAGVPSSGVRLSNPTGYASLNGTSMAAPHVVSYAALVFSTGSFTEDRIKFLLFANNDDVAGLSRFVASAGRINLLLGLDVPRVPPIGIEDFNANRGTTHSAAYLTWTSPGDSTGKKLFGANLYFSTKEFNEKNADSSKDVKLVKLFPLRKSWGEVVLYTLPDLTENTSYYAALQVFDRGGGSSPLSSTIKFGTRESKILVLRTFETESGKADPGNWTVIDGPFGSIIKDFFDENPLLWNLSETGAAGGSQPFAWHYGLEDKLNYENTLADSILTSEVFDARQTQGLSIRYNKFQQIGNEPRGQDVFELYIKILDNSNRGDWQRLKIFPATENSTTLKLGPIFHDLSTLEGKKFQVGFRFLSVSSGSYIGPIIDNFEIRVDK